MHDSDLIGNGDAVDVSAHEEFERRAWSEMHETYDSCFGRITAQTADVLLSAVKVSKGTRLLEVACGTGNISWSAHEAGAEVIGIDFIEGMVQAARTLHPGIDFRVGDAQSLEFRDESFDAVVCNFGVHHFARPIHAIQEARRILRNGGHYAFTVWSPPSRDNPNLRQIIRSAVDKYADNKNALPPGPQETYFASPENCCDTLIELGFVEISTSEIPLVGRWNRAEQVLDTIYHAMIRSKTLIEAQSHSARNNIKSEILKRARDFQDPAGIAIPMPAMLTHAVRK